MNLIRDAISEGEKTIKLHDLQGKMKEMVGEYEQLKRVLTNCDFLSEDYIHACDSTQIRDHIEKLEDALKVPEKSGADVVSRLINSHIGLYLAYRRRALLATEALKNINTPSFVNSDTTTIELCVLLDTRVLPHVLSAAQHLHSAKSILNIKPALESYQKRVKQNRENASLTEVEKETDKGHILEAARICMQVKWTRKDLEKKNSLSLAELVDIIYPTYGELIKGFIKNKKSVVNSHAKLLSIYRLSPPVENAATARLHSVIRNDPFLQEKIREIIPNFTYKMP